MFQNHDVILFIQKIRNGFFDFFFTATSWVLDLPTLILVVAIFYWCINKKYSVVFTLAFFVGSLVNGLTKIIVNSSRPDGNIVKILYGDSTRGTSSFPSGHSQYASMLATGISLQVYKSNLNRKWLWYTILTVVALLGGLARMYLGVHFLEDVIVGLAMGIVLMVLLTKLLGKINNELWYFVIVAPLTIVMFIMQDYQLAGFVGAMTALMGGYWLEKRYIKLQLTTNNKVNALRVVCGYLPLLGIFCIKYFLLAEIHFMIDYFYFVGIGAYITLLAPFVFTKFSFLNDSENVRQEIVESQAQKVEVVLEQ